MFWKWILLSPVLFLVGCHVSSKSALDGPGGRTAYNNTLQETNSEQMLLNLVRLRYYDIPFFLDVGTVTTQLTYKSSAFSKIQIPGFTDENPAEIGADLLWQSQPTIQYTPLQGQSYASQLLQPISLRTLQQLCYSGWGIDRVFHLIVQGFNGLVNNPESSGPLPEHHPSYDKFFEASNLLRYFQEKGELQVGVHEVVQKSEHPDKEDLKKDKMDISDYSLQFAFPGDGNEAKRLSELLTGVSHQNGRYFVKMKLGFDRDGKIGILPRSILSSMYYLSQGVHVPKEHIRRGWASECIEDAKATSKIGSLIDVYCSGHRPSSAFVSVKYRDWWFYIKDSDLDSKKTFVLLMQLYNLQGGAFFQPPPLLTLPLG